MLAIDLDRGVWMRSHPSIGMDIYMYVDDPGVYYDAHGNGVPKELAEAAGFDVETLQKEHLRKTAMDNAMAEIDAKYGSHEKKVVKESGGYQVWDLGLGRYNVTDAKGNLLNKVPITKEQYEVLLKHLAPTPEKPILSAKKTA